MRSHVESVCGPVAIDSLGFTLTHEHLWCDTRRIYYKSYGKEKMSDEKITRGNRCRVMKDLNSIVFGYKDNVVFDCVNDMVDELRDYRNCGGNTIFEVSTIDLGRDPIKLRELSQKSGVNIIMGGTYYYYPSIDEATRELIDQEKTGMLADLMIREFYDGVGNTGIKPGVLGELGLQYQKKTDDILLHAAIIAQRETDAPLIVHYAPYEILDIAEKEGANLNKIVMGHWSMENKVEEAVKRGAWVSFDQFGMNFPGIIGDEQRINDVITVFEHGWERQLLLSQDIAWKVRLKKYGGEGFGDLIVNILPKLRARGLTESQLHLLFCENPQSLLR